MGLPVVDLSADFRLVDAATYELWYGPHGDPDLLENAVYGLTELDRERIALAELVANPGCYPTAALLALAPLAERGLIGSVVIDAKSGVSGAGRGGGERLSLVNLTENLMPYAADGHRHLPEIEQELKRITRATSSASPPGVRGEVSAPRSPLCRICCRSTRGCWRAVMWSSGRASRGDRRAVRRALRGRPVRRGGRRAARACATCARPTSAGSTRSPLGERPRGRLRRDRQPLEGRRRPGDPEPQPDARARRDGRAAVSFR